MMMFFFEVMDKEPTLSFLIPAFLILGVGAFLTGRKRPIFAIPFVLLLAAVSLIFLDGVNDPALRENIIHEAGLSHVILGYVFLSIGALLAVGGVAEWIVRRSINNR